MPDISVAAWGKTVGISRQSAHDAVKRCGIPLSSGKVDADVATTLYRKRTRARANDKQAPVAPTPPLLAPPSDDRHGPESAPDYQVSRAWREAAEAELAQIKVRREMKELIEQEPARAEFAKQTAAVREGLLAIPARLAPVLAAESSLTVVQSLLDAELRAVLAQFVGVAA